MTTFKSSVIINRSPDIVTKALMNADNFPFWETDLVRFEVIKGKPGEAGAVGHLHYLQKGKSYVMKDELLFCDPGKKYISRVSGDALTAQVETTLRALGDKTEMEIFWKGEGKILFLKLFLPLLRGKLVKQSGIELKKFKKLVETYGANFQKDD